MQLMVKEGMTWTCPVKYYQTLPKDAIATELGSENMQHVSGHDIVQYPDTGEILYISAGWLGTVLLNMGTASGFVCVDTLLNDCDTIDSFTTYNAGESGAYDVVYDNPKFVPAHLQGAQRSLIKFSDDTADVPGVSLTTQILALSAEVLPSGRLVVMVATRKQLVSLVSDDRGVTFRGSVVMDLTFNGDQNYEQQRWLSLDTCVDRNGKMLVLVVGQGLGDRRNETLNQGAADAAKTESLCSVFVTADGEDFGTEKRLGYGPNSDLLVSNPNIPPAPADPEAGYWQLNDLDDAVHCLSGSISMLPNGYICAQVITLQYGSPTGTHAQWVAQCVFSTQDVSGGDTDADIAKALNKVIHERGNPVQSRIGRFVPSMIQYGRNHYDTGIGNTAYSFLRNAQVPGAAAPLTGVDTGRNWGQTAQTIVSAIDPSNNGWISFGGLARTGGNFGTNNERFGGGPVFLNGPVDIAQTLYRDRMISMVCWYYEAHPSDFPGYKSLMESTYRHDGTPPPAGVVEYNRSVAIYQSAHLQPLNVRIPSQLKAWAPLICPGIDKVGAGIVPKVDKVGFPVAQDKLYNGNTSGWSSDIVGGIDRSFLRGGVFAGNTFSVAWDASNDPVQQMWDLRLAETGATAQYRDSDAWDRIVNGCWETYHPRGNGYYGYYMYPGQFTFQNQDAGANIGIKGNSFDVYGQVNRPLFMPNPMSLGMTSYGIDTGGVNKKDYYLNDAKGGLGFVCRFVFMPIAGTEQYNSSYTNNHPVTGVEVRLCKYAGRTGSGSTSDPYVYKFEKMIVGLDAVCETLGSGSTDTGKVNLYMLVNGQRVQNAPAGPGTADATIELEFDPLPAVEAGNLPPVGIATPPRGYVEVVFGMKEHETQPGKLHAFFYAREWKRGQDPDFIADFKYDDTFLYNSPMITFEPGAAEDWNNLGEASTGFLEYIKMGHIMASSGNERDARWKSLQFARSFLEAEPCNASLGIRENNTLQTIRNPTIKDFAMDDRAGDTDHELFRFLNEPAMQQFQVNESGVMCPMRPPLATANPPQMIDRGLEIQMRGRASTPRRFEYEAKSRFDPMLALSPPISYGYRGSKQTAQMQVFSGTDNVGKEWMHYTPAAEISYDFGEDGVRLSSIAAFGVNNPSVILEFTNKTDPDSGEPLFYANLDPTPSETTIVGVCPPCDPWVKATMYTFENLMSGGAATFLMRTRYLFYGQYVQPGNSLPSTLSDTDYNISFSRRNTATVQNKVTFTAKGYDARYGAQPFTPHQFRSEQGESYYLTIYTREGFNPSASNVALTHFGADDLGVHKHVFKIADNSSEALYLTSDDANIFGNYFDADSGNNSGLEAAAWCITSDRFGLNVPEKIMGRTFRYMRVRFSSAVYHDPNEKFHTLAYLSTGPKMDMSNRDFDWGWSVNAKTGNTLTTSRTGQRRSRRNHKARRTFTVKYTPKPEVGTTTQPSDSSSTQRWDNATSLNIQNPKAGYGQFEGADSAQDSQVSVICLLYTSPSPRD